MHYWFLNFDFLETEAVSEDELLDGGAAAEGSQNEEKSNDEPKKFEGGKRKLAEGEYDPSSPTSENSQDDMPASKKLAVSDSKSSTPKPVVSTNFFFVNSCLFNFNLRHFIKILSQLKLVGQMEIFNDVESGYVNHIILIKLNLWLFLGQENLARAGKVLENSEGWPDGFYWLDISPSVCRPRSKLFVSGK